VPSRVLGGCDCVRVCLSHIATVISSNGIADTFAAYGNSAGSQIAAGGGYLTSNPPNRFVTEAQHGGSVIPAHRSIAHGSAAHGPGKAAPVPENEVARHIHQCKGHGPEQYTPQR
jgi:hypothetical protein